MNNEQASATLLSITQSVGIFSALLPHLAEVRRSAGDPSTINDVRIGEVAASALVVSIGLMASALVNSPVPAGVAVVSAVLLVAMYESVLQSVPHEKKA